MCIVSLIIYDGPTASQRRNFAHPKPTKSVFDIKAKLRCLCQLTAMILKWMIHMAEIVRVSLKRNSNQLRQSSSIGRVLCPRKLIFTTRVWIGLRVIINPRTQICVLEFNLRLRPKIYRSRCVLSCTAKTFLVSCTNTDGRLIRDVTIVSVNIRLIRLLFFFHVNAN